MLDNNLKRSENYFTLRRERGLRFQISNCSLFNHYYLPRLMLLPLFYILVINFERQFWVPAIKNYSHLSGAITKLNDRILLLVFQSFLLPSISSDLYFLFLFVSFFFCFFFFFFLICVCFHFSLWFCLSYFYNGLSIYKFISSFIWYSCP